MRDLSRQASLPVPFRAAHRAPLSDKGSMPNLVFFTFPWSSKLYEESVEQCLVLPTFPSTGEYDEKRSNPEIKLKVIAVEDRTTRTCDFDETKKWDWTTPK